MYDGHKWLAELQKKQVELAGTGWNTDVIVGKGGIAFYCDHDSGVYLDAQLLYYFGEQQCVDAWNQFNEQLNSVNISILGKYIQETNKNIQRMAEMWRKDNE